MIRKMNIIDYLGEVIKNTPNDVYIVFHKRGDFDSVLSGYIIWKILKDFYNVDAYFICPDKIAASVSKILPNQILKKIECREIQDISMNKGILIFIDVGGEAVLSNYKDLLSKGSYRILIDHHIIGDKYGRYFHKIIINEKSPSTLEIILCDLIKHINLSKFLSKEELWILIYTLIVETRFLQLARHTTLNIISQLLELYGNLRLVDIIDKIERHKDISEIIAIFRALQRLNLFRYNNYILIITKVSAYHNKVSSKLLSLGADAAIVYSINKECKIHIRFSSKICSVYDINVVKDIIRRLEERYKGSGGGHKEIGNIIIFNEYCIKIIDKIIIDILSILKSKGLKFKRIR